MIIPMFSVTTNKSAHNNRLHIYMLCRYLWVLRKFCLSLLGSSSCTHLTMQSMEFWCEFFEFSRQELYKSIDLCIALWYPKSIHCKQTSIMMLPWLVSEAGSQTNHKQPPVYLGVYFRIFRLKIAVAVRNCCINLWCLWKYSTLLFV